MNDLIPLRVLGLSYSKLQSGAFALILQQIGGPYRIPVVIGASEAQSIAIVLEGVRVPRPMTHDLFESFTHAFGIQLRQVKIYRFEDGIFSSELTFTDGDRTIKIDARTSDAIAIALRTKSPIYTTAEVLAETGFVVEDDEEKSGVISDDEEESMTDFDESSVYRDDDIAQPKPENMTIEELERTLVNLIDKEEYEEAARIQQIIDRKRGSDSNKG